MTNDIWNISGMYKTCEIRENISLRFLIWKVCKQSSLHFQQSLNNLTVR